MIKQPRPNFEIGCKSVEGTSHAYQDRILVDMQRMLFAVTDGVTMSGLPKGAQGDGAIAAQMLVDLIRSGFKGDLKEAILKANSEIIRSGTDDCVGGESTITSVVISGDKLAVANVGDSPACLLRNGRFARIHAPDKGYFGGISQSVGYGEGIDVHQRIVLLSKNDLIAIASDDALKVLKRNDLSIALDPSRSLQEHTDELISRAEVWQLRR